MLKTFIGETWGVHVTDTGNAAVQPPWSQFAAAIAAVTATRKPCPLRTATRTKAAVRAAKAQQLQESRRVIAHTAEAQRTPSRWAASGSRRAISK